VPYAKNRYRNEAHRLYGVMDRRLSEVPFLAGDAYSIADIASYPWVMRYTWHDIDMEDACPNVWDWLQRIGFRPAVARGMDVPVPA